MSSPTLVAFGELLDVPCVRETGVPFQQLQVFAYGTYKEYLKAGVCTPAARVARSHG